MADEVKPLIKTNRGRPGANTEGVESYLRAGRYGELSVQPMDWTALAEEGSFFTARNPTIDTVIVGHAAPTDLTVDTKPLLYVQNTRTAAEGENLILKYLMLTVFEPGTAGTVTGYKDEIEGGATDRLASAGTDLTIQNVNMASTRTASARIKFGAPVAAAAGSTRRILGQGYLRTVIDVVGDKILFVYGEPIMPLSSMIVGGTAVGHTIVPRPPVILGPSDQYLLHFARASQSAAVDYVVEMGFVQR